MMVPAPTNGLAVTSMVLGILSVVLFCAWYLTLPLGIAAVVLGIVGLNQINKKQFSGSSKGMAIAGLITGGVGLLLGILFIVLIVVAAANISTYSVTSY
jgi:RsiW-degrading membrane proteinase PrsW (M82 family)